MPTPGTTTTTATRRSKEPPLSDRKTYTFNWSAHGTITVRGDSPEDAEENAIWAIRNLITADACTVTVKEGNIN